MKQANPQAPLTRWQAFIGPLQHHWQALGERERAALRIAAVTIGLLLAWLIAVQPALRVLSQTPAQLEAVDLQLQDMQSLALEAGELRAMPAVPAAQAAQALQAASAHLGGGARLTLSGDRAVLTLSGVATEALQAWLGEVRSAARARPVEAQLQRGPRGYTGTIVLALGGTAP